MKRAPLALAALTVLGPLVSLGACDSGAGAVEESSSGIRAPGALGSKSARTRAVLEQLERFAWVAPGRLPFNPALGVLRSPALDQALLVERFEVTRGDWLRYVDALGDKAFDPRAIARWRAWPPHTEQWPAAWMNLNEARAYARWRGLRLPTAEEWTWVAIGGPLLLVFPWSRFDYQASVANTLDLRLDPPRPTPVGTFEEGTSVTGCYDLYGNVAEWTLIRRSSAQSAGPAGPHLHGEIHGGSYLKNSRPTMEFREVWSAASRGQDVGLRCVVPAEDWLRSQLGELDLGRTEAERLRAVGRRFGRAAEPSLERLASEPRAPAALELLLAGARS